MRVSENKNKHVFGSNCVFSKQNHTEKYEAIYWDGWRDTEREWVSEWMLWFTWMFAVWRALSLVQTCARYCSIDSTRVQRQHLHFFVLVQVVVAIEISKWGEYTLETDCIDHTQLTAHTERTQWIMLFVSRCIGRRHACVWVCFWTVLFSRPSDWYRLRRRSTKTNPVFCINNVRRFFETFRRTLALCGVFFRVNFAHSSHGKCALSFDSFRLQWNRLIHHQQRYFLFDCAQFIVYFHLIYSKQKNKRCLCTYL